MNKTAAWKFSFSRQHQALLGIREVLHLIYEPQLRCVPQTPSHCSQVLVFEKRLLPAWDVTAWLDQSKPQNQRHSLAAIVGYQDMETSAVKLGALLISEPPVQIYVSDADVCALPAAPLSWHKISRSCISSSGSVVPILDLQWMFSTNALTHAL